MKADDDSTQSNPTMSSKIFPPNKGSGENQSSAENLKCQENVDIYGGTDFSYLSFRE